MRIPNCMIYEYVQRVDTVAQKIYKFLVDVWFSLLVSRFTARFFTYEEERNTKGVDVLKENFVGKATGLIGRQLEGFVVAQDPQEDLR